MRIAWIGTGVMGYPMVSHLIEANHEVSVYNRSESKTEGLKAHICTNIKDTVKDAEVIITMVGYPKDVKETYKKIFKYASKDTICIDMTTSDPLLAQRLFKKAQKKKFHLLDAPVSGGEIGAKNGSLSIMVGGEKDVFDYCLPIFEKMGSSVHYLGQAGNGQYCKMANQIVVASNLAAVSEAIQYAKAVNLDPQKMLSAISGGAAGSWQVSNSGPKILNENYKAGFYIHHFIKDLNLVDASARKVKLKLYSSNLVLKNLKKLVKQNPDNAYLGTQAYIESLKKDSF